MCCVGLIIKIDLKDGNKFTHYRKEIKKDKHKDRESLVMPLLFLLCSHLSR